MKTTLALLLLSATTALAGPAAGRILVLDVAKPDNTFSTLVTRGEAMLIRADLYNRGAVYTNNDLTGFLWYSSNRTDTVGVKMQSTTNTSGSVWFSMSASDSMGLATNDTFPKSYWAQVVLTNASYRYDWQQGQFAVRDGGGVTGTGTAGAQQAFTVTWEGITGSNPGANTNLDAYVDAKVAGAGSVTPSFVTNVAQAEAASAIVGLDTVAARIAADLAGSNGVPGTVAGILATGNCATASAAPVSGLTGSAGSVGFTNAVRAAQTTSGGAVTSVFSRVGDVTAQAGDYTAGQVGALTALETTNLVNSSTNALDIALRALIAAATQAATNYTDAATNALNIALRAVIVAGDLAGTNYADSVTNALRIWAESRVNSATNTIAGASVVGAVGSATVSGSATNLSDGVTWAWLFSNEGEGEFTNELRVGNSLMNDAAHLRLNRDGKIGYSADGARWHSWIDFNPLSVQFLSGAWSYTFGIAGNVHTQGFTYVLSDSNSVQAAMAPVLTSYVTNGQSGVTLTGTLTPTNSLTVTNALQLGGIAAASYTTNALQAWGFVDPAPTAAVQNVQWTPYFAATGTVRGVRGKTFSGAVVADIIKQNWTNAAASYTTVYTGLTFGTVTTNVPFTSAIAAGDLWGVVSTNVTSATNWWFSLEWTP